MRYFAEHLSRINSVALVVETDNLPESLFFSGEKAVLVYKDSSLEIPLPAQVEAGGVAVKVSPISVRIPSVATTPKEAKWASKEIWPAKQLAKAGDVAVNWKDGRGLVTDSVKTWKALPSEHWAELMDFWHCHKPAEDQTEFNPAYTVGKFDPRPGIAYVGDAYLLLDKADVSTPPLEQPQVYGSQTQSKDAIKIWKWDITISAQEVVPSYPSSVVFCTILQELVDSHAIYTFDIADPLKQESILLWIFNASLHYVVTGSGPQTGMKVLYCTDPAKYAELRATRPEIEEVVLPLNAVRKLKALVTETNHQLPETTQLFGKWNVSLLAGLD